MQLPRIVEGLFLGPSHYSIGLQCADLIVAMTANAERGPGQGRGYLQEAAAAVRDAPGDRRARRGRPQALPRAGAARARAEPALLELVAEEHDAGVEAARAERPWLSPSSLTEYLGCAHAAALSRQVARGERQKAFVTSPYLELIFAKGNEHEADVLSSRSAPRGATSSRSLGTATSTARRSAPRSSCVAESTSSTRACSRSGAGAASPTSSSASTSRPRSARGATRPSTPSSRATRPCRHTRCSCASTATAIERVQGVGTAARAPGARLGPARVDPPAARSPRTSDARARHSRRAVAADAPTEPFPCAHCAVLRLPAELQRSLARRGSPVARRRDPPRPDRPLLMAARHVDDAGAARALPTATPSPDIRRPTLAALTQQARLQVEAETTQAARRTSCCRSSPAAASRGCREPSAGDVMFDLEGDPFWTPARD